METNYHYFQQMEEWQHFHHYRALHQKLRIVVKQANLNKSILRHTELSPNDKEVHRLRFKRLITRCQIIDDLWKQLNYNYDSKKINKIITILKKIKDYDKERATQ